MAVTKTGEYKMLGPTHLDIYEDQNWLMAKRYEKIIQVGCGKCQQCMLKRSRQWAMRAVLEGRDHKNNEVVTLTYDDKNLPLVDGIDVNTGEATKVATLKKEDTQLFRKKLRKAFKNGYYKGKALPKIDKIRFIEAGEYGDKYKRPHYHMILYGAEFPDKKYFGTNEKGKDQWTSEILTSIWQKGICTTMPLTYESAAYVARYILKKQKGQQANESYKERGQIPEYINMSRKPGIAFNYYDKNKDKIYETDEIFVSSSKKVEKHKPPRYFDKLFEKENKEKLEELKKQRQIAGEITHNAEMSKTNLNEHEYANVRYESTSQVIKKLKRNYENGK